MKSNKDIALEYVDFFCTGNIAGLSSILSPNLQFQGPLYTFNSSEAYLDSLKDNLSKCDYHILEVTENRTSVAVFYDLEKPDKPLSIAQLFKIHNGQIEEILLIFDARGC